jgi:hypothetical protein
VTVICGAVMVVKAVLWARAVTVCAWVPTSTVWSDREMS